MVSLCCPSDMLAGTGVVASFGASRERYTRFYVQEGRLVTIQTSTAEYKVSCYAVSFLQVSGHTLASVMTLLTILFQNGFYRIVFDRIR